MNKPEFLFLSFIFCINFLQGQVREEPIEVEIGKNYKINYILDNSTNEIQVVGFYQFHINQKIENEDIIVILTGNRDFIHSPFLFMSSENKFPDGYSFNDTYCGMVGLDVCSIPQSQIKDNSTYYLGIFCQSNCKLEFKINYYTEKVFYVGDSYVFKFNDGEDTGMDFKVVVPESDMTEILIEVFLLNVQQVKTGIQLIGRKGNDLPSLYENQFDSYDIWWDGKAIKLSRSTGWNPEVSTNFTFLIVAGNNSRVKVNIEGYHKNRNFQIESQIKDILLYGENITYQMYISDWTLDIFRVGELDISFDLEPYTGIPELYINAGFIPQNLSDYDWKLSSQNYFDIEDKREGVSSLTISNDDFLSKMQNNSILFITVKAQTSTSFRLESYMSDYFYRELDFNTIENGYLENGDLVTYDLKMDNQESNNIIIKLHSIKGTAFLYIKECTDFVRNGLCEISIDEILQANETTFLIKSEEKQNIVKFYYSKSDCQQYSTVQCLFTIGVYAPKSNETIENHYRLIASHQYSILNLKENQNHFSYILIEDKEYYKFFLPGNDTSVEKVQIQVTALTGSVSVMISRSEIYPNITNNDFVGVWEINTYQLDKSQGKLDGYYYIGIDGLTTSNYNIIVKVYRKQEDGALKSKQKRLYFGVVEQGLLNFEHVDTYFFYNENGQSKTNLFFYYTAYDIQTKKYTQIIQYPQIKLYHQSKEGQISEVIILREYYSNFVIFLQIKSDFDKQEIYFIEISQKQENVFFKFSLSVNQNDIFQLIPDVMYTTGLNSGDINKFEIYLQNPSLVYFELFECFGEMTIKGSQTYQDLENQVYNINRESPQKISYHSIYKFSIEKTGKFFFSVITNPKQGYLVNSLKKNESLYMLIPHVLSEHQETPHDIFYTYDDGKMTYEFKDNELRITVRQLQADFQNFDELPFNKPSIYYYVAHLTSKQEFLNYFSKCELDKYYLQYYDVNSNSVFYKNYLITRNSDQYNRDELLTFVFTGLEVGKTYYVQIIVDVNIQMNNQSTPEPFAFLYMPQAIKIGDLPNEKNITDDTDKNDQGKNNDDKNTDKNEESKTDETNDQNKGNKTDDKNDDHTKNEENKDQKNHSQDDNKNEHKDDSGTELVDSKDNVENQEQKILGIVEPVFYMIIGGIITFILAGLFIYFRYKRNNPKLQHYQVQEIEIGQQGEEQQNQHKYDIE